jgi:folate-binding protein YgfZ
VELKDISEKLTSIQVIGPESRNALLKAGVTVPQLESMQVIDLDWNGCGISLARGGSPHFEAYEIWVSPGHVERLLTEFKDAGAARVGTEALEMFRISQGIPAYGQDIWERYLPQETNQAHALHFVKGCYVGQEIVERIRARANVHRGLVGFVVDGHLPAVGSKVQLNGKDVGEVTSSVSVPTQAGSANIALGYLRHEAGGPGTEVQIEKVRARVAALPFEL